MIWIALDHYSFKHKNVKGTCIPFDHLQSDVVGTHSTTQNFYARCELKKCSEFRVPIFRHGFVNGCLAGSFLVRVQPTFQSPRHPKDEGTPERSQRRTYYVYYLRSMVESSITCWRLMMPFSKTNLSWRVIRYSIYPIACTIHAIPFLTTSID